jgi:hypothetical protein
LGKLNLKKLWRWMGIFFNGDIWTFMFDLALYIVLKTIHFVWQIQSRNLYRNTAFFPLIFLQAQIAI